MKRLLAVCWMLCVATLAQAGALEGGRCVAPAKAGGGFDLTCQFTRNILLAAGLTPQPLAINHQPGGIGALAFKRAVNQSPPEGQTVVAFSSGSLLNLAQGRFGPYRASDVRWLAVLGMDHGVVAVRRDSPYKTLGQLLDALRAQPGTVVFGAGGSIGSQDWMKTALLARAAGVSHKEMRFVAFEGGGEALSALTGRHVQVLAGDAAEVGRQLDQGAPIRVLATLSEHRLGGRWAGVPTAREQGFDVRWSIVRGLYMGPRVPEREQREWSEALTRAMAHPSVARELAAAGMEPAWVTGPELERLIHSEVEQHRKLAAEFGLVRP